MKRNVIIFCIFNLRNTLLAEKPFLGGFTQHRLAWRISGWRNRG